MNKYQYSPFESDKMASRMRIIFWSLWAIALLLKLQNATMLETADIYLYSKYGLFLAKLGFAKAYASSPIYNIPPLAALYAALLVTIAGPVTSGFAFLFNFPGIVAESVVGVLLWRRFGNEKGPRRWIGVLAVLNPVAIPVTGLHGNLDGLLSAFVVLSILMAMDNRPIASGIWFGLAANLKVSPILLVPAFSLWWAYRGSFWRFGLSTGAVVLVGWSPGLIACPALFLERVMGYSSVWGTWGISRLLFLTDSPEFSTVGYGAPSPLAKVIASILKVLVVVLASGLAWRRRVVDGVGLAGTVAATWLTFLVLAPGGAPQYAIWPLVPLLLDRVRLAIIYVVAAAPLMVVFYPFAFDSVLPFKVYPLLVSAWSELGTKFGWTWLGLLLWATATGMLAIEWKRWWRVSMDSKAGNAGLVPASVGSSEAAH